MCFTAGFQLYIFQFSRRGKHIFLFCWGSVAPTATWVWLCYLVWNSNTWTSTTSWSFLHLFQEIGSEPNWNRKITRKMRYSRYQLHQHYYTTCRRKKMRNMLRSHIWPKKKPNQPAPHSLAFKLPSRGPRCLILVITLSLSRLQGPRSLSFLTTVPEQSLLAAEKPLQPFRWKTSTSCGCFKSIAIKEAFEVTDKNIKH